jgi:hypothetical protein
LVTDRFVRKRKNRFDERRSGLSLIHTLRDSKTKFAVIPEVQEPFMLFKRRIRRRIREDFPPEKVSL